LNTAKILLEILGDSEDGRRALADMTGDLALFSRETAEAEADLDTTTAKSSLDELKAQLQAFSAENYSTDVNVQIAKAVGDLAALQAELDRIDNENVTVDVDVRRGISERIGSLVRDVERLGKETESVSKGGLSGFVSSLGEAVSEADVFGVSLKQIAIVGPVVVAAIVAVVGQIAAIVASASNAVAGLGALGVAFGSTLPAAIALGIGAVLRFKEQSKLAGTAAHALRETFGDVADTFKKATAGGSDALFKGLPDALRSINPLVKELGPAFTKLGKAGGDAFRLLGKEFASPAWRKFFVFSTESLTKLTPLFARSFGAFAKILRNIATAAMPFLIQGFRLLAKGLDAIAGKTSDIKGLRNSIGGMVDSLRAWGKLLGGVTDLVSAFVSAFAPFGDEIVASLGEGAEKLADWLRSSEGSEKIKQFFEDTGPLAKELVKFIGQIALVLLQLGEFVAPVLAPIVRYFNKILEAANAVLSFLNDHVSRGFREFAGKLVTGMTGAIDRLKGPVTDAAKAIWEAVKKAISAGIKLVLEVDRTILSVIGAIWKEAKDKVRQTINFFLKAPRDVLGVIQDIWREAKEKIRKGIDFVLKAPRTVLSVVQSIWGEAKEKVRQTINFFLKVPHDAVSAASAIWGEVKEKVKDPIDFILEFASGIVREAEKLWNAINNALPDITIDIHIPTPNIPGFATGVRDIPSNTLALVGEEGPELRFIPQGADVFTAGETRRILRALARGAGRAATSSGSAIPAAAGGAGGGDVIGEQNFNFITPGTGNPDPRIAMAQAAFIRRQKGRRKS
jgi:phage-related protein